MAERRAGDRATRELLTACVREHDWQRPPPGAAELLPRVDQDQLLRMADRHRVTPAVGLSLRHCDGVRTDIRERLDAVRRDVAARQLLLEVELARVRSALRGTTWLIVKGPALAHGYYRRPELRAYADLDVLVPAPSLEDALALLEEGGYSLLDRNWTLISRRIPGELHLRSPRGVMIDLHWDLSNDRSTRDSYGIVTRTLFERAVDLPLPGAAPVRTLDALDTVIHTAVHAARSGGDRLMWMKDLEQVVLGGCFSWGELAERCAEHRAQLPVSIMLHRARASLGLPTVTDERLRQIGGSRPWRGLGRIVDRVAPVTRAGPDGSLTRMYARATRADGYATARELMHRVGARMRRRGWTEEDHTWDASHPNSVLHESGGTAERSAFFAAVVGRDRADVHQGPR